jgi:ribosomal RNA-processing protein 12
VFGLFSQNLKKSRNAHGSTDTSSTILMTLDILVLLLPYLSTQDASELFDAIFSEEVLVNPDNAVQKRAYKILARLVEGGKMPIDVELLFKRLDESSDGLSAAAKKVILTITVPSNVTHLVSMHHTGSNTTIFEPTSFDPSFSFTCYPITDS